MINDLNDKYIDVASSCFSDHFYDFSEIFNYLTDRFIIILGRLYRSIRIIVSNCMRIGQKSVGVSKINRNYLNKIFKITAWSSKYRFLDQCSQLFTSRDESSEYLTRFYTFKALK
jgi:hypothetical protein